MRPPVAIVVVGAAVLGIGGIALGLNSVILASAAQTGLGSAPSLLVEPTRVPTPTPESTMPAPAAPAQPPADAVPAPAEPAPAPAPAVDAEGHDLNGDSGHSSDESDDPSAPDD